MRQVVLCLIGVLGIVAACGGSSTSSAPAPSGPKALASCRAYACSGGPTSCGLLALCGSGDADYLIECGATGCNCSVKVDGGRGQQKAIPADSSYCARNDPADAAACTDGIEQSFAKANVACGWGLD